MANILVLDDVQDVATMLKAILEAGGHKVFAFTEEQDAIEHARSHPTDLAILDIKLKRISGIEILEELKKIDPNIHVMILTGYPTLESARASIRLGAEEYCVKPIEIDELEQKVAAILSSAQTKT
jgi:DNA-binding NtrC family response regulator